MGRYECVAENSVGTEHTKQTNLYVKVRRVPPTFSRPPEPVYEVMLGGNLSLACVAVGSPMPYVKWRQGVDQELTPENDVPVGRNVMELTNIRHSANYTCVASSTLGIIEATTLVKVQCEFAVVASTPGGFVTSSLITVLFSLAQLCQRHPRMCRYRRSPRPRSGSSGPTRDRRICSTTLSSTNRRTPIRWVISFARSLIRVGPSLILPRNAEKMKLIRRN